jgi:hypothetical protein
MINKVTYIENFLSQEECDVFIQEANKAKESDWQFTGLYNILKSSNHKTVKDIKNKLDLIFDNKFHIQRPQVIHKTDIFSKWQYHSDDEGGKDIKYGIVIYLNNNFKGGETSYKKINFNIIPKAGSIIIHPANDKFQHTVTEVTDGIRYTLTSFAREQK